MKLTCKQIAEMVTDRAEGALSWLERIHFDRHLASCEGCRAFVTQLSATTRVLRHLPQPETSPLLQKALEERFATWAAGVKREERVVPRVTHLPAPLSLWPALGCLAVLGLLSIRSYTRTATKEDLIVGGALTLMAFAVAALGARFTQRVAALALLAAIVPSLVAGRGGGADVLNGLDCVGIELVAGATIASVAWLVTRASSAGGRIRLVAAGGLAGAITGDAFLQIICRSHHSLAHLLAFHSGGILLVAVASFFALRGRPFFAGAS